MQGCRDKETLLKAKWGDSQTFQTVILSGDSHNMSVQGSITRWCPSQPGQTMARWESLQKYFLSMVTPACVRLWSDRVFWAIPRSSTNVRLTPLSTQTGCYLGLVCVQLCGKGRKFSLRWKLYGISLEEERIDPVGVQNWEVIGQDTGPMSQRLPDPGSQACSAVAGRR